MGRLATPYQLRGSYSWGVHFSKPTSTLKETTISSAHANIPSMARGQHPGGPAAQLAEAIRQERPVMAMLGMDTAPVSAALDECIELLRDDPIRVIRIRGLPGAPLTLPRIVEELGADQPDRQGADDDELIVRVLASRGNKETLVALIIEQAELLPLPTLVFLQVASTVFGTRTPRLQLIFAGHPRFEQLLVRGELAGLRDRLQSVVRVARLPVAAAPATPARVASVDAASRPHASRRFGRGAKVLVALLGSMLIIAAATFALTRPDAVQRSSQAARPVPPSAMRADPPLTATALPSLAQPQNTPSPVSPPLAVAPPPAAPPAAALQTAPPRPAPSQLASPDPLRPQAGAPPSVRDGSPLPTIPRNERGTAPSGEQLTRLRGEFDRFLAQTEWGSKRLGEGERARLFKEYLRWNYGAATVNPAPP